MHRQTTQRDKGGAPCGPFIRRHSRRLKSVVRAKPLLPLIRVILAHQQSDQNGVSHQTRSAERVGVRADPRGCSQFGNSQWMARADRVRCGCGGATAVWVEGAGAERQGAYPSAGDQSSLGRGGWGDDSTREARVASRCPSLRHEAAHEAQTVSNAVSASRGNPLPNIRRAAVPDRRCV